MDGLSGSLGAPHMPCSMVSSDGVALGLVAAVQGLFGVWGRLGRSGKIWWRWSLVWYWFVGLRVKGGSTMAIRMADDGMTLEIDNCVVASALFSEDAAVGPVCPRRPRSPS
jgi:hypothetical protein